MKVRASRCMLMRVAHFRGRVGGRGSCRGMGWEGVDVLRVSDWGGPVMRTWEGSWVRDGRAML